MRLLAGFAVSLIISAAAIAAEPAAIDKPGEADKAAAIAELETLLADATAKKKEASKAKNREAVKDLAETVNWWRLQLSKAKSKPPEKYAEEAAERKRIDEENARLAAEKKRKEAEHERMWPKKEREANERKAAAGFPMPAGEDGIDIVYATHEAVRARLKNPAGAKFPGGLFSGVDIRTHCKYNGDGTYTVTSWVDATNSFGGQLRVPYVAKVKKLNDGYEVSDVVLID
jgi:hypothetical protein